MRAVRLPSAAASQLHAHRTAHRCASATRAGITMGMPPHTKCCGCCCNLHIGTIIGTGLYVAYLFIVTPSYSLPFLGKKASMRPKRFAKGPPPRTAKATTLTVRCPPAPLDPRTQHPHPRPCLARRLQLVSRLRYLHQRLGRGGGGRGRGWLVRLGPRPHFARADDRHVGPCHQEARRRPQDCLEADRGGDRPRLHPADH